MAIPFIKTFIVIRSITFVKKFNFSNNLDIMGMLGII